MPPVLSNAKNTNTNSHSHCTKNRDAKNKILSNAWHCLPLLHTHAEGQGFLFDSSIFNRHINRFTLARSTTHIKYTQEGGGWLRDLGGAGAEWAGLHFQSFHNNNNYGCSSGWCFCCFSRCRCCTHNCANVTSSFSCLCRTSQVPLTHMHRAVQ